MSICKLSAGRVPAVWINKREARAVRYGTLLQADGKLQACCKPGSVAISQIFKEPMKSSTTKALNVPSFLFSLQFKGLEAGSKWPR